MSNFLVTYSEDVNSDIIQSLRKNNIKNTKVNSFDKNRERMVLYCLLDSVFASLHNFTKFLSSAH